MFINVVMSDWKCWEKCKIGGIYNHINHGVNLSLSRGNRTASRIFGISKRT